MKKRIGFVSNSSSTSYIVFVPKGFEFSKKDLDYIIKECSSDCDNMETMTVEIMRKHLNGLIDQNVYNDIYDRDNTSCGVWMIIEVFEKYGLVMSSIDGDADAGDTIIFIKQQEVEEITRRYNDENKSGICK